MTINIEHIKRYTGDDEALIAEVLTMFTDQTALWLRALDPDSDDEGWSSVAHAIKGSARTLGAVELGDLCERAENMVGATADTGRRGYIKGEIEGAIDALNADIKRWQYDRQMRELRS